MLAFLQYLIAIFIVQTAEMSPGAAQRPDWTAIGATIVGFALAARIVGRLLAARPEGGRLTALLVAWNAARGGALAAFLVLTAHFGGAAMPAALGIRGWVLVPHLVCLAPFLALTAGLTWGLFPAAHAAQVGSRTAARAVAAELRGAVLPLAPVLLVVTVIDVVSLAPANGSVGRTWRILNTLPAAQVLLTLSIVFGALLVLPFVMRLVWRASPLPDGTLRRRLDAYSRRTGFRARDILVWPTGGEVLNAAVLGALPRFRYVLVTDALLHTLDEDEIEAVFAHEVGHARRGHVLLFFGFTAVVSLVGITGVLGTVLAPLPQMLQWIALLLVWMGVVFGWVSRRFEQEADVFGIETLPRPSGDEQHPFARALERIGAEVGEIREVTGWRHFSIADRVEFVRQYVAYPQVRSAYRRSIGALRWTLYLVIGGCGLLAAVRIPGEIALARAQWSSNSVPSGAALQALDQAVLDPDPTRRAAGFANAGAAALAARRTEDSLRWLRESRVVAGAELPREFVEAEELYAVLLQGAGRPLGARLLWQELAAREDLPPKARETARRNADALTPR